MEKIEYKFTSKKHGDVVDVFRVKSDNEPLNDYNYVGSLYVSNNGKSEFDLDEYNGLTRKFSRKDKQSLYKYLTEIADSKNIKVMGLDDEENFIDVTKQYKESLILNRHTLHESDDFVPPTTDEVLKIVGDIIEKGDLFHSEIIYDDNGTGINESDNMVYGDYPILLSYLTSTGTYPFKNKESRDYFDNQINYDYKCVQEEIFKKYQKELREVGIVRASDIYYNDLTDKGLNDIADDFADMEDNYYWEDNMYVSITCKIISEDLLSIDFTIVDEYGSTLVRLDDFDIDFTDYSKENFEDKIREKIESMIETL